MQNDYQVDFSGISKDKYEITKLPDSLEIAINTSKLDSNDFGQKKFTLTLSNDSQSGNSQYYMSMVIHRQKSNEARNNAKIQTISKRAHSSCGVNIKQDLELQIAELEQRLLDNLINKRMVIVC